VEKARELKAAICPRFQIKTEAIDRLIDSVASKSVELLSSFEIDPGEIKPFSLLLQEANEELRRINLSYEQVVMEAKQARMKAEELAAELIEANTKLRELAFRDGLTGLYNYRYFQELMDREVSRAVRYHLPLGLMLFDIDFFKKVNDTYGHPAGDVVLRNLATLVKSTMRNSDMTVRYGGEEFAVILPMTDLAGCKVFAERLRRRVEEMETVIDDIPITITISIGLTTYEPSMQGIDKSQMMRVADSALYQAKHKGRNRLVVGMLPV
jgi:diguanylate cyclase (GGDEF)-like protein